MTARGFHLIEDDLLEGSVEEWAETCVGEMEDYLAKHAAFLTFLDDVEA
jgi:hypothetical protein